MGRGDRTFAPGLSQVPVPCDPRSSYLNFFCAANLSLLQHLLIISGLGGADWVQK